MQKQKGSITNVLLGILIVVGIVAWGYGYSPAKPEDVQAVVQKAKASQAATLIVQSALKEHPTPTIDELHDFSKKVDEQLTLEIARSVTGDSSLHAGYEKQDAENLNNFYYGFKVLFAIIFILLCIFGYRKATE